MACQIWCVYANFLADSKGLHHTECPYCGALWWRNGNRLTLCPDKKGVFPESNHGLGPNGFLPDRLRALSEENKQKFLNFLLEAATFRFRA